LPSPNLTASAYGNSLLDSLGATVRCDTARDADPAQRHTDSGLLALTGHGDRPPVDCPLPLAICADGALAALSALAGTPALAAVDGARLLGQRAALMGLTRNGRIAPGGSCRLLPAADGWLALNLARDDDWELLPAWLETEVPRDWDGVAAVLKGRNPTECVERGRLLGLAVASSQRFASDGAWLRVDYRTAHTSGAAGPEASCPEKKSPLVVDLSSLWAGPLCSHLLQRLGAHVIKVESAQRPDGARRGNAAFFAALNDGKDNLVVDFAGPEGCAQLRALCERADIVIEASRPRALRQLGIVAERIVDANPKLTWLGITGYGRREPMANWVAFGDDAAVAAGLSQRVFEHCGDMLFCGDAVADPLTGLHAALAAWHGWQSGGGCVLDIAMRDVVANCLAFG
jgi:hypothetical protein